MSAVQEQHLSIAHVSSPQVDKAGDFIYRIVQPGRALASLPGIQTIEFSNICSHKQRIFDQADVLIINFLGDPDFLPIIRKRREAGKLTVFEINDYFLRLQPWNPVYYFFKDPENKAAILQLIEQCDCVQVSCHELRRRFSDYNPRVAVFENQMNRIGESVKPESPITIGWGGSHGHLEDIQRVAPVLIPWFKQHPEARLRIMGSKQIFELFNEMPGTQKTHVPPGSLEDYYRFLRTLHIGLAPLLPTDYNLCRSDVKFLEYGAMGLVPVCSDLEPYRSVRHAETGFLFKDPAELPGILDRLVEDSRLRKRIAENAHGYIRTNRMESQHAETRLAFYKEELERLRRGRSYRNQGWLSWLHEIPETETGRDLQHVTLGFGPVEKNLYNGLVYQFQHNRVKEAIDCFQQAKGQCPDFHVSSIYLGSALEQSRPHEAVQAYSEALTRNPGSCLAAVLLGQVQHRLGNLSEAARAFRKATEIGPWFARAWRHLGLLYLEQGDIREAKETLEHSLSLGPESFIACFYLGNIAVQQGDLARAEEWYLRALAHEPDLAAAHANLSRLYSSQGKHEAAQTAKENALRLEPALQGKI